MGLGNGVARAQRGAYGRGNWSKNAGGGGGQVVKTLGDALKPKMYSTGREIKKKKSLGNALLAVKRVSFLLLFFLWPHLWHMEVLRLGAESELQLPAYTTATPDT